MKNKKVINILVLIIGVVAIITSLVGILSSGGDGEREFVTVFNEKVTLYGEGIYKNDSISVVAQGRAQDYVTLSLGVLFLFYSLIKYNKNTLKGKLLLLGALGFFLYTFVSYTFLWTYNELFLLYVLNMSCSLFAFILLIMSIDIDTIKSNFSSKLPTKLLGGIQIFIGFAVFMLWIGKIGPALMNSEVPLGLEHYTTLVIQALDLGIIVPLAFISGILLIKKNAYGYLLSSVVIIKGIALLLSIMAMIIAQIMAGVSVNIVEIVLFSLFTLLISYSLCILLKNIDELRVEN